MWKWLCSFIFIASTIVSVAYKQHYAREKYHAQAQADCIALAISTEEAHSCANEAQGRKYYAPWWYILVAWPEGITTWAIIATGFVVAWQSSETRKSAEATLQQVGIQRESIRPRLAIGFVDNPYAAIVSGRYVIVNANFINSGGIPAHGVIPETWLEWLSEPYRFTENAIHYKGKPLSIDTKTPKSYRIPLNRGLTTAEISDFRNGRSTICIRIRLRYEALGKHVHTEEAYYIEPGGMGGIPEYSNTN